MIRLASALGWLARCSYGLANLATRCRLFGLNALCCDVGDWLLGRADAIAARLRAGVA